MNNKTRATRKVRIDKYKKSLARSTEGAIVEPRKNTSTKNMSTIEAKNNCNVEDEPSISLAILLQNSYRPKHTRIRVMEDNIRVYILFHHPI